MATALSNTMFHAKAENNLERRDALLDELQALAGAHSEDAAVRALFAKGLATAVFDAVDEGQPERQAKLREQLSALASAYPEAGWVEQARSLGLV